MTEPNLYKIEADLQNLGKSFERMNEETREYRTKQTETLSRLATMLEHQKNADDELRSVREEIDDFRKSLSRIAAVSAFVAGSAGIGFSELVKVVF